MLSMTSADRVASRRDQALDWLLRVRQAPQDAQLRADCEAWCAEDPANAKAYRKAERAWQLTGELSPQTTQHWPQQEGTSVADPAPGVSPKPTLPPAHRRSRRGRWVGAAVAACLVLALAPSLSLRLNADYRTGVGEIREVTLADGSVVRLDSDSAIAVDYAAGQRDVRLLSGQAFFEVRPDKARPFHVQADRVQVTVTGTAFNVVLRPQRLAVEVQHGSVRVDDTKHARLLAQALTAGQRLRYLDGQPRLDALQPSQVAAWRNGQLIAENLPVADVVRALAERLPGKVWLKDTELGRKRVTGVYDLRKPEAALAAVVRPYGGEVRGYGPLLLVLSRPQ